MTPTNSEKLEACPDCGDRGWYSESGYESGCCGGSDWECGARGCTGPIQVEVEVQVQCERCTRIEPKE